MGLTDDGALRHQPGRKITASISEAATFSPPTLSMSFTRSLKKRVPSRSMRMRSPVENQPSSLNASAVAWGFP